VRRGKVKKVVGLVLESEGPKAPIGEICELRNKYDELIALAEIVGFRDDRILSMVLGETNDIEPSTEIIATGKSLSVGVGDKLLGRVIDGLGRPLDGKAEVSIEQKRSIYAVPPNPLLRKRISEPISTGIKAVDGLLTLAKGQRVGILLVLGWEIYINWNDCPKYIGRY
jgi:flagellum-specific ATP synthase